MGVKIVAEIGINHNGDINIAKQLMMIAKAAGCDYVKFQKRTPELCVPDNQKNVMKSTPWGEMTYLDYKKKIEFGEEEYAKIEYYAKYVLDIGVFASVWDKPSADFMRQFQIIGNIAKIPSALITDLELVKYVREKFPTMIISTGMSTEREIGRAIEAGRPDVIMHTNSEYPAPVEHLNLRYLEWLKQWHPNVEIGYSGHEYGIVTTFAAVALGATWVERHITLDHTMWGSDQSSSIEPNGLFKLVKGIRDIEKAMQYEPQARILFEDENKKRQTLRK